MFFDRNHRSRSNLKRALRAQTAEPPATLVEEIVGRVADAEPCPRFAGNRLRLGVGFALTAILLVAMAAFGGVGYAQTAVLDTTSAAVDTVKRAVARNPTKTAPATSSPSNNFAAAVATYPAPMLTCAFVFNADHTRFKITGTTTVASGTISVTVTSSPPSTGYPATKTATIAANGFYTTGNFPLTAHTTPATTYTATVTQTITGYDTATCTVSATG
ncbi:hypothetical protein BH18ACT13_BH18ACT13_01530 [soil metagenome]